MTPEPCTLCGRDTTAEDTFCSCGASLDWLRRAPKMLREKLGRTARRTIGAAAITTVGACTSACSVPPFDSGAAVCADAGCAADARAIDSATVDSGAAVCADAGCSADPPDSSTVDSGAAVCADAGCSVDSGPQDAATDAADTGSDAGTGP